MWQLFQFPLCPFSRKVRLVLAEKGIGHELVRENPWEKRDEFIDLNPAGETPVMVEPDQGVTLIGSQPIVEYFDETVDRMPMIHGNAALRAEIRRMTEWFDIKLYREAVEPLMNERMRKRLVSRESPDTRVLREAMRTASEHLDYLDYLLDHRRWLAGPGLSLADFTAAAHLSVIDYLGALDWRGHKQTKDWYAVMKSRPCFRPLLGERMEVIVPPGHYDKVDSNGSSGAISAPRSTLVLERLPGAERDAAHRIVGNADRQARSNPGARCRIRAAASRRRSS